MLHCLDKIHAGSADMASFEEKNSYQRHIFIHVHLQVTLSSETVRLREHYSRAEGLGPERVAEQKTSPSKGNREIRAGSHRHLILAQVMAVDNIFIYIYISLNISCGLWVASDKILAEHNPEPSIEAHAPQTTRELLGAQIRE